MTVALRKLMKMNREKRMLEKSPKIKITFFIAEDSCAIKMKKISLILQAK